VQLQKVDCLSSCEEITIVYLLFLAFFQSNRILPTKMLHSVHRMES
jgi:hypothetical protein